MKNKDRKIYDLEEFRRYRENRMTPKEQHYFEKEMLDNPLIAEAYEGYLLLYSDGKDYTAATASLRKQSQKRSGGIRTAALLRYAASVAIISIAGYFLITRIPQPDGSLPAKTVPVTESPDVLTGRDEKGEMAAGNISAPVKPETGRDAHKPGRAYREMHGRVTGKSGKPIAGAQLFQSGTKVGETDSRGAYRVRLSSGDSVEVMHIGYLPAKLKPSDSGTVILENNGNVLNDLAFRSQGGEGMIIQVNQEVIARADTGRKDGKPRPAGGWENFEEYLKTATRETLMYGRTIEFTVLRNGRLENISVEATDSIKAEIIRILQEGPRWIPGSDSSYIRLPGDLEKRTHKPQAPSAPPE